MSNNLKCYTHLILEDSDFIHLHNHSLGRHNLLISARNIPCILIEIRDSEDNGIGRIEITKDQIEKLLELKVLTTR
jgi:hypothetical protein